MPEVPWRRRIGTAPKTWVAVLAVAAGVLGWLPFLGRTLSPDEGGYLVVGGGWTDGPSLYGAHWVDRPPVLMAIFGAADHLGGAVTLRLFGALAVVLTVVLAGVLGRMAAPERRSAPLITAGAAAALCTTPLFGGTVVNGEVLGLPFIVGGLAAYVASSASRSTRRGVLLALLAGACAALAVLLKQSLVDVAVVALVLLVTSRQARGRFPVFLAGAVVTVLAVAGLAALRGTEPASLWDAVVTFRFEAAGELAEDSGASPRRFPGLIGALLGSGLPLLVAALGWKGRGQPSVQGPWTAPDLRPAAYVLLVVEILVALLGGSYWLHYLMSLVPGVVLLAAAFAQRPTPVTRSLGASFAFAGVSSAAVLGWVVVHPIERREEPAIAYLQAHAEPGESGVVVLGAANILREADLEAPYTYLWSLPARVRDPELSDLADLLGGPEPPDWALVAFGSARVWHLDLSEVRRELDAGYEEVARAGKFTIFRAVDR